MKSELKYYLENDFEIYEELDFSYNKVKVSLMTVDSLTKEMIKIMKKIKREKIVDIDQISFDEDITYRSMLKTESNFILRSKNEYNENRAELKSIFKNLNQDLLFIKEETLPFELTLPEITFIRNKIEADMILYMDILNNILFKDSTSEYSSFIIQSSKKIQKWERQLDSFEKFVENINSIARKEAGGFVVLRSEDEEPLKFLNSYQEGLENYKLNIDNIHKLVKLF